MKDTKQFDKKVAAQFGDKVSLQDGNATHVQRLLTA